MDVKNIPLDKQINFKTDRPLSKQLKIKERMKTLGIKNFKKDQKIGVNKEAKLPHVASLSDKTQLSNIKSPK